MSTKISLTKAQYETLKERRYKWTDAPHPFCRYCRKQKLHTKAQHEQSTKLYRDKFSFDWKIEIRGFK